MIGAPANETHRRFSTVVYVSPPQYGYVNFPLRIGRDFTTPPTRPDAIDVGQPKVRFDRSLGS